MMIKNILLKRLILCLLIIAAQAARAQGPSEEEIKKVNNPLADAVALNFQDYYVPSIYDNSNEKANTFLLRYAVPFAGGKILTRFTLPLVTTPTGAGAAGEQYASGLGDFNFFATYTLTPMNAKTLIGIGPQVAIPTASYAATGTGKWQLGGALVIFNAASPVFQWGGLITFQGSIAGDADRAPTMQLQAQPFALFQLGKGTYLRSTGLMTFNMETGSYNVPLGVGIGQVAKAGKVVFNIFIEPQYTILHQGVGQPALQTFTGINCQF